MARADCSMQFELLTTDGLARRGRLTFPRGAVDTPAFMPVGTYGHQVGDQVLKEMGQRLRDTLRADSAAIRWGGEEFLVLVNNIPAETAHKVVERLLNAIRQTPFTTDEGPLRVTASLGGCPINVTDSRDLEDILIWADRALYLSKQQGRNRACVLWPTHDAQGQLIPQNLAGGELEWIGISSSTSSTGRSNDMRHAS